MAVVVKRAKGRFERQCIQNSIHVQTESEAVACTGGEPPASGAGASLGQKLRRRNTKEGMLRTASMIHHQNHGV
jgi:hypothetical protein